MTGGQDLSYRPRAQEGQPQSVQEREQLLQAVSHDLKAPLSAILLHVRLLQRHVSGKEMRVERVASGLDSIEEAAKSMVKRIDELVAQARGNSADDAS